ncbi:TOBE domain-containing protein [Paenibacillus sp. CC-CFT747]|nr:TOBE domain-containing protein [Paenibacillus sp. CC-CFT747]
MLGIRCEHVFAEGEKAALHPKSQIPGSLIITELMGADMYLYIDIGAGKPFIARTVPGFDGREEEKLTLSLDMQKALFFDKDTTENLMT